VSQLTLTETFFFRASMIFGLDEISMLLWFLSGLVGFVVGSGLKHSFKMAVIILVLAGGGLLVGGLFVASVLPDFSSILSFIDPAAWLTGLFDWVQGSAIAIFFAIGCALGCWKG